MITLTTLLALTFPVGASAEPSILLGGEVQPSAVLADTAPVACQGCLSLAGTINGPADAIGFKAAGSPYDLAYDWTLNAPCHRNKLTWGNVACPAPVYSGPISMYIAPHWFTPETDAFYVWGERPVSTCHPHVTVDEDGIVHPAEPQECPETRCSRSRIVTLPATVTVACEAKAAAPRHHTTGGTGDEHSAARPRA